MKIQNSQKGISALLIIVIIAIVAIVGGGYYAMSKKSSSKLNKNDTIMQKNNGTTAPIAPTDNMQKTGNVVAVEVSGSNFKFEPNTIKVKVGDTVKVTFKNVSGTHDFRIDEFNIVSKMLKSGESDTVEFKVDKAGIYKYYCSVGQHRKMGMEGTLIVE